MIDIHEWRRRIFYFASSHKHAHRNALMSVLWIGKSAMKCALHTSMMLVCSASHVAFKILINGLMTTCTPSSDHQSPDWHWNLKMMIQIKRAPSPPTCDSQLQCREFRVFCSYVTDTGWWRLYLDRCMTSFRCYSTTDVRSIIVA